jgi:hypothetical protein
MALPSIEISRKVPQAQAPDTPMTDVSNDNSQVPSPNPQQRVGNLHEVDGQNFKIPHVIISLALDEDQVLNTETCGKWLSACPTLVKYAKVEGVYKSYSTLVLLSIPVSLWDMLPEDHAYSFVGYTTSPNLLRLPRQTLPCLGLFSSAFNSNASLRQILESLSQRFPTLLRPIQSMRDAAGYWWQSVTGW